MKTTIHQEAQFIFNLYFDKKIHKNKANRRELLRKAAKEGIKRAGEANTAHLSRDFRPNIGSGRTAHWLQLSFQKYQVIARTVHKEINWTGEEVRKATKALLNFENAYSTTDINQLEALPPLPDNVVVEHWGSYSHEHTEEMARNMTPHVKRWYLYLSYNIRKAIAIHDGQQRLQAIQANPDYKISGYLADSIISWKKGDSGYEGCSGLESYDWHKEHPEHWDTLLAHAPQGAKGEDWEQVFPHERERATKLREQGWFETFRMNDSLFTKSPPSGLRAVS